MLVRRLVLVLLMLVLRVSAADVLRVDIDNVVHPVTVEMVADAVDQARTRGSAVLLVRLNTPGGLMSSSRELIEELIASPVPVVTWVAPSGARAASAGFFLLLAGDVAAMAPGTNTGAASPVVLGQRVGSDHAAQSRERCRSMASIDRVPPRPQRRPCGKAVSEAKSFTEQEALDSNLINLIAKDETELLSRLDGTVITRFDGTKQTLASEGRKGLDLPTQPPPEDAQSGQRSQRSAGCPASRSPRLVCGVLYAGLILPGVAGAISFCLVLALMALLPAELAWRGPDLTRDRAICA